MFSALAGGAPKTFCITYDLRSLSPNYQYIMIPWPLLRPRARELIQTVRTDIIPWPNYCSSTRKPEICFVGRSKGVCM